MKRYFLIIPLFLIVFSFIFPSKIYAISCCPSGTSINPAGTGCTAYGSFVPFQCTGEEPLCNKSTYTCVSEETEDCGAHGQKCCGTTCKDALVCIYSGQQYEECVTVDEAALIPGNAAILNNYQPFNLFCEGDEAKGINTAIGCIKVGTGDELITTILRLATGLGGGIALALILYGVFIVTTSAGMPDKLKAGSEIITSAIIGLLFIILSVFLVNLIGINILGIPGLS